MMGWSGKLIGALFGFLLAGPLGLLVGIFIGHIFDKGLRQQFNINLKDHSQIQQTFFSATFLLIGYIAKSDGRISESEINAARAIMERLQLSETQRAQAINWFNQGKQGDFNFDALLLEVKNACRGRAALLQLFVEIQLQVALAEGALSQQKFQLLQTICQRLNYAPFFLFAQYFHQSQQQQQGHYYYDIPRPINKLKEAYLTLGIQESVTDVEVKRAYRRLMSQNHPDKLVSKGLPEEMLKLATEKTQKIQAAYEQVCAARGM